MASKQCNVSVDGFYPENYTLYKNLTVFLKSTRQNFARGDYGVVFGHFVVCSAKLSLSCNDDLIEVKNDEPFSVSKNFSLFYKKKIYDYREYRFNHDSLEVCSSDDPKVQAIWKTRNSWEKSKYLYKCRLGVHYLHPLFYAVNNQFTVFSAYNSQYLTRSHYVVKDGKPHLCGENFRPISREYTHEDQSMCNDSIINIKYDNEYKVWNNISIFYKNKVYDYTEYRVLNDGIKICNSTDADIRNIWKVRNVWVKERMYRNSCNEPNHKFWFDKKYYAVDKHFTVYLPSSSQYFTRDEYGVTSTNSRFVTCTEKLRPTTTQYTQEDLLMCNDSIINIKYDNEYKVWNNFSIFYKNKVYDYTEYRALNDGIKICNSTDAYIRNIWKLRNDWVKLTKHFKSCKEPSNSLMWNRKFYVVNRQFTVYLPRRSQHFTRNGYGVKDGRFIICKEKLGTTSTDYTQEDLLMCNDSIINIKYDNEYKVWNNFSIFYKNKVYDYTEYRALDDGIKICNSTDAYIRNIWKLRNDWVKLRKHFKSCKEPSNSLMWDRKFYVVNGQFTVYLPTRGQHFTRNDYGVKDGRFVICREKSGPISTQYTQEDLSMCSDSIINIKYNDEYKVWNNFSIFYKNKMYDYTEYPVLNDGIKICNSTDDYVRNTWKLRNKWIKEKMHLKSCNEPNKRFWFDQKYYSVDRHFTVYLSGQSQYFLTRNDYGITLTGDRVIICREKLRRLSIQFTQEDLLMCNDSIIIKYIDEYKVWNNFSIFYTNKMYDYTEYRVLNDSIKICNSTDDYVRNTWKLRNKWVKERMYRNSCNEPNHKFWFYKKYYAVDKHFTVYLSSHGQYFTRNDYGVTSKNSRFVTCKEKLRPTTTEYTQEDLSMCNDSIINIKYDEEYEVWNNFSIFYKNKVYDYTEYRVLNDGIKICNSTDADIRNIWKVRNKWVKLTKHFKSCKEPSNSLMWDRKFYVVNGQFTVYLPTRGQHFTRNGYGVKDGRFIICKEKLGTTSTEYTQEDLLMCNDSIINIKYNDEYEVRKNFSIFYKNKVYDYTEYRVLNDGIKICNSADVYIRNIWKVRNVWVKATMHYKTCNESNKLSELDKNYYAVDKHFTVHLPTQGQHFTSNNYGVRDSKFTICTEKLGSITTEYTQEDLSMCNDSIINIEYDDEYKVWKNFSIFYKNKVYDYTEYRVLNDGIMICNSTDDYVRNTWKLRNKWIKEKMHLKSCNEPNHKFWFYKKYYAVDKHFTVYLPPSSQYFTRDKYGVTSTNSRFVTCKEKLTPTTTEYTQEDLLMCNDSIINIKYDNEYKVWNNFSIFYKNKVYDYTEYRALNDGIKICNSTDVDIRNIWKLRNDWVKLTKHFKSCKEPSNFLIWDRKFYVVNRQFTVYLPTRGQHFTRNGYGVKDGRFITCKEKLGTTSTEYTQEDLLMCNNSIINIKYDNEYKVWNNFSIFYKNKVYDYTEYRVLNDSIKICNSTDADIRNIWKLRNDWVKERMYRNSCNEPNNSFWFDKKYYAVDKHFTVYLPSSSQYFTRDEYGVTSTNSRFVTCTEKLRPTTTQYTQEDLLMCNDSIINIKYDNEYKVWNNFTIFYKNKMYDYTEYRVLNDGIKICNSTDDYVRNTWKLRNKWVKERMYLKSCNEPNNKFWFYKKYYAVDKHFTVYLSTRSQYFTRNDYGVTSTNSRFVTCKEKLRPISTAYTQEDLSMCNDSIINIEYDNEYKVWKNFSIFYKNKVYDYTEYRVLNDGIKICNSTDADIRHIWKLRNLWVKATMHYKTCNKPITYAEFHGQQYTVLKDFRVRIQKTDHVIQKYDYGLWEGKLKICSEKLFSYAVNIKVIIAPLCALAISFISLLLLLIVYCMLPELRTLPGLNLMSLSFAFLLWQTYLVVFLSVYSRVGSLLTTPCATLFVTTKFLTYSILMNAAVNIYHLRKTFCGNTLVKSDVNKWRTFLRYSLFSWGIPVVVTIVYIVLVNTGALRFEQYTTFVRKDGLRFNESFENGKEGAKDDDVGIYQHISGDCINGRISPEWSADVDVFGLQGCLLLCIVVMFIFTAYRIRQKLKASSSIAQKSNIRQNHKFLILVKLSTTTALSYWLPLFISRLVDLNFDVKIALYTVTLLTGAYIGFAFAFTRRNFTLLKKKYSPAKHKSVRNTAPAEVRK